MIILPGNPLFDRTLALASPPDCKDYAANEGNGDAVALVADAESGLFRPANWDELQDYCWGGEWETRMRNLGWTEEELEHL